MIIRQKRENVENIKSFTNSSIYKRDGICVLLKVI